MDTTTEPTNTTAGTEITGTGYSAGGQAVTFGSPSAGVSTGHSSDLTWTNGSGSSWNIGGAVIHGAGASAPLAADCIYWIDSGTFGDYTVPDGADFVIPANGISATET